MKNPDFAYARPQSLENALSLLRQHGKAARLLAGGQSLIPLLAARQLAPELLIDIGAIPQLSEIKDQGESIDIGAMARHADIGKSPIIQEKLPLLVNAVGHIAHAAVRNRGTLGGSLCQAERAAEFPACALALDASLQLRREGGARLVRAVDFFRGGGLAEGEILEKVIFPGPRPHAWNGFGEIAGRDSGVATAGLAAHGECRGGQFRALTLVFFGVGLSPICATATAAYFKDTAPAAQRLADALGILKTELVAEDAFNVPAAMTVHLAGVLLRKVMGFREHGTRELTDIHAQ